MKILKGKSRRTLIFTAITVAVIIAAIVINLLLSYFGTQNTVYIDLTERGIYSLTDRMVEECAFVDELDDGEKKVKVTFCTDPDYLINSSVTRATYFMALKLRQTFDNIDVETVNVTLDPLALSKYKVTSLTTFSPSDIIVSYGERYMVVDAANFWSTGNAFYDGEYVMASVIKSITAFDQPAAYFTVGHGETVYDPENPDSESSVKAARIYDLLVAQGLKVKTIDLSADDAVIPDDCALLVINNPRTDFELDDSRLDSMSYVSEVEKIDRYLINNQGSVMVARDYHKDLDLKTLDGFLAEWGFEFGESVIADEESSTAESDTSLVAVYNTDKSSVANVIYSDYANVKTSPKVVVSDTGYMTTNYIEDGVIAEAGTGNVKRSYSSFLTAADTANAYLYTENKGYENRTAIDRKGTMDIAGLTVRSMLDEVTAESVYSSVFCAASGDFFSSTLLGNDAYANYGVVSMLANTLSRVDVYASIDLGSSTLNSSSVGGKPIFEDTIYDYDHPVYDYSAKVEIGTKWGLGNVEKVVYTVLFSLIPAAALVLGVIVCVKRRYL